MNQILLRPKVALRRLDGSMAQQQLNLFKFAATGAAQLGASAAEVMRSDTGDAGDFGVGLDELPDDLFAEAFARYSLSSIH